MHPLPAGLTARPLSPADAEGAYAVYAADELADAGALAIEIEDIEGDWARPSFDLTTDSIGVVAGDTVVGAAEVFRGTRAEGAVHPDARGRGIGTWLATWTEARARAAGAASVGQSVPAGSMADRFLAERGYEVSHLSWVLRFPEGTDPPDRPLPQGFSIETAADDESRHAAYTVIEDAFSGWPGREWKSFADWAATAIHRPGFEEWQLCVARDPDGQVAGACFVIVDGQGHGLVDQVAVRPEHRGLGLGAALLADGFGRAREHGAHTLELATDSRTGALGLYERIGMVVAENWVRRELALDSPPPD